MAAVEAEPYEFEFDPKTIALVMIDFQRDFVDPGGFGEALGNDVSLLRRAVPPAERVLKAARARGLLVIHTREEGHDIVKELYPGPGEPVVDKPGKGAFFATDLDGILKHRGISHLVVCGVTTEVCVNTTVREANDRGYECLVLEDCVASYFPEFQKAALAMIKAQGCIFGWVSDSTRFLDSLAKAR